MDALEKMVANIKATLARNGYPERKVALPLERMYETAHAQGINFNKVLERLAAAGIRHEKTAERLIFSAAPSAGADAAGADDLKGMMAKAAEALAAMSPAERAELENMVKNLSPEQREELMRRAKDLFPGKT